MAFSLGRLVEVGNRTHFYRPLVEIYFGAASGVAQCSAAVFHSLSLLIHALNAALAGWLVHRLTSRPGLAVLTALLFAFQSASSEHRRARRDQIGNERRLTIYYWNIRFFGGCPSRNSCAML